MAKKYRGYQYHYEKARENWLNHFDECAQELCLYYDYQEKIDAVDSFHDAEQCKIIWDYETGEHMLKIKWEHACWWAECKHPVFHGDYYCVVLPLDRVDLHHPSELKKVTQ